MQNWQRMAADRLTQLQDAVNLQAENFCNSIGALQMYAKESPFPEFSYASRSVSNSNTNNDQNIINDCKTQDSLTGCSKHELTIKSKSSLSKTTLFNGTNVILSSSSSPSRSILIQNLDKKQQSSSNNQSKLCFDQDNSQLFARLIARTAKDIDTLIESLPPTYETEAGPSDLYSGSIRQLDEENSECISRLEEVIKRAEAVLEIIQNALDEIALMQLQSQNVEAL